MLPLSFIVSRVSIQDEYTAISRRGVYGLRVKLNTCGAALSLFAAAALVLSACSGGGNASSAERDAGSVKVDCGGKKELKASGSTAQANAMPRFVSAFEKACSGQT